MARPKLEIDVEQVTKLLKDKPSDIWSWAYSNNLKGLFIRTAPSLKLSVVRLGSWIYLSNKLKNKIRTRIKGQLADHIIQNYDLMNKLPFTIDELIDHLDKQGMDWDNINRIHIDHIIPKSSFRFNSFEDETFKECWSLKNLRPLSAKENLKKGSKRG